jgi:hypothetical protein
MLNLKAFFSYQIEREGNENATDEKIGELKQKLEWKLNQSGSQPLLDEFFSLDE